MNQVVGEICRRIWVYHERILGKEVGGWMVELISISRRLEWQYDWRCSESRLDGSDR